MPSRPQVFRAQGQRSIEEIRAEAEQRRGSARERGYGPRWDRVPAGFKLAHPVCLGCEAVGQVRATAVTDHVEPHKGDMIKFWNAEMWQPACAWHHDTVKQQLEQRYAKGELTIADLWLNSPAAIALTLDLIEAGGGG